MWLVSLLQGFHLWLCFIPSWTTYIFRLPTCWDLWVLKFTFYLLTEVPPFIWLKKKSYFLNISRVPLDLYSRSRWAIPLEFLQHCNIRETLWQFSEEPRAEAARVTYCFRASIRSSSLCLARAPIHSSNRSQDRSFSGILLRKSWREEGGSSCYITCCHPNFRLIRSLSGVCAHHPFLPASREPEVCPQLASQQLS